MSFFLRCIGEHMALLTTKQAAEHLLVAAGTLENWRTAGGGPKFVKLGRKVAYDTRDLDQWIEDHKQKSTADRPRLVAIST
jgi:predicted DNA-binding transcriptional regulator AlpA